MRARLTADAGAALGSAGLSRRNFLRGSGAMVVAFAAARHAGLENLVSAQGINGRSATALDAWIAITADSRVLAYTGKCELGQGLYTAQVQLVAEELDVPLRVTLTMCDTSATRIKGTTSGAQSPPRQLQSGQPGAGLRHSARGARAPLGADRLRGARRGPGHR
jgi:CO/xanthine dehydrogenase Mo-binding subunit